MASVFVPDQQRTIVDPQEIAEFLKPFGIWYERWQVEGRLKPSATDQDILDEYAPEIDAIKKRGGFVTADVINVNSNTPNLDVLLTKSTPIKRTKCDLPCPARESFICIRTTAPFLASR
jgi:1,2-dihydroxy-3-keto-5-methylthiopentene dioxygenase